MQRSETRRLGTPLPQQPETDPEKRSARKTNETQVSELEKKFRLKSTCLKQV